MARNDSTPVNEQLQDLLLESPGFAEFLLELTMISASLLGSGTPLLCAITVERAGAPATVASSTEAARRLDEQQYAFDDGPCLTALRQQHTVLIPDLAADARWNHYAQAVSQEGIRSVLAVPIATRDSAQAALNCYSLQLDTFGPETVSAVEEHAASISRILQLALRLHSADPYPEHLRAALESRAVVDAAVALIMLQNNCSRDVALEILLVAARNSNERLHVIAQDLLKRAAKPLAVTQSAEPPTRETGGAS
ncbi:GAF and ANTAR domain-containing protein [Pseudarthrobacter equi]|uniref:GAF and ANTAR domain-containing protein n=1 Tax=Pseudarthrobacter TaxID=1742993 RepID=UPI00158597AA|nr:MULTISPECIES: GAF and ANTAR domain-containing protein [Pseudarthrobacter]MCT9625984.1 GAF and ANTAR domain-containing protein [Pseudarthrobacter equi]NUT72163.1 GAF and ANTAR domain-containing protein [Pseudarthrobacter sp. C4D7]